MRGLKVLVIVMGVMLVAGIIALGFAVRYRMSHPRPTPPVAAGPVIGPVGAANALTLDLPQGAKVVGAEASGDRLVVRVELAAGAGEELIIVNLATGAPVATVTLRPKTAP